MKHNSKTYLWKYYSKTCSWKCYSKTYESTIARLTYETTTERATHESMQWCNYSKTRKESNAVTPSNKITTVRPNWWWWQWLLLYSTILCSRADSLCSHVILHEWLTFYSTFVFTIHRSGVLTALAWLVPHETTAISAQVLCTPYNYAPCHFMQRLM